MKIYITFGQEHYHELNGNVFDKDCVAVIEADDHSAGRKKAFELFGNKWAFEYTDKDHVIEMMHYFPRGIVKVN